MSDTETRESTRERLELEQIKASIEEMRSNNELLTKRARWYVRLIVGAGFAASITLAFNIGELYATLQALSGKGI